MENNNIKLADILPLVQNAAAVAVTGTALIPVSGFIVFHTNLSRYTDLYSFDIKPNFYILAGLSMWLASSLLIAFSWVGARLGTTIGERSSKLVMKSPLWIQILLLVIFVAFILWVLITQFPDASAFVVVNSILWILVIWVGFSTHVFIVEEDESRFDFILETIFNPFKVIRGITRNPLTITTLFLVLVLGSVDVLT